MARKVRLAVQDVKMVVLRAAKGRYAVVLNGQDAQQTEEAIDVSCGSDADLSVQSNSMDKVLVHFIATSQRHLMISSPSHPMMKT
uniref:Uncharacterized protein n=1 Tax=Hyaloperonospora arabidopsidis (strain Emoy2) TaxID=559515 RepID=M4BD63_HYAAE